MLIGDFEASLSESIAEQQTDDFLNYYYHFFKFIYATELGDYNSAREYCKLAEELLVNIPDEAEKAEFNYRVSLFYYYISQYVLSIHYATKAQEFFSQHKGYEVKIGACKNTLGMACSSLKQYELSEEYFIDALDIFQKANDPVLISRVRHNLGLLYADQNLSEIAIRHFNETIEDYKYDRTTYLLAREHFKLNNLEEVEKYIEKGLKSCNKEYRHHFLILKAKSSSFDVQELEGITLQGIEYFKKQELWNHVQEYAEDLAIQWFDIGEGTRASIYFHMSYQAKEMLQKKGALK
nr:tetratricopeptide repeat protein [Priestia taiwanensis]